MKIIYGVIIFVSLSFNGFVQSYAYTAWKYNIPLMYISAANNDTFEALNMLSLKELGEVKVS